MFTAGIRKVISPKNNQIILADPTIINPDQSPDKYWHLYCHSTYGIQEYVSKDGESWTLLNTILRNYFQYSNNKLLLEKSGIHFGSLINYFFKLLLHRKGNLICALRPFLYSENSQYYLFYEEINYSWKHALFKMPTSRIMMIKSANLKEWCNPVEVLNQTKEYPLPSCPSVVKIDGKYLLYFTYNSKFTGDNSLMEPKDAAVAESTNLENSFQIKSKVRVMDSDNSEIKYIGCLRVRKVNNHLVYTCNPIRRSHKKSFSQIFFLEPIKCNKFRLNLPILDKLDFEKYNLSNAYVADFINYKDNNYIYFNVRAKNRYFDKFKIKRGIIDIAALIFKNLVFNKEYIYLIKY